MNLSEVENQVKAVGAIPVVPTLAIGGLIGATTTSLYAVHRATMPGIFPETAKSIEAVSTNFLIVAAIGAALWFFNKNKK